MLGCSSDELVEVETTISIQVNFLEDFIPFDLLSLVFEAPLLQLSSCLDELIAGQSAILVGIHCFKSHLESFEIRLLCSEPSKQRHNCLLELVGLRESN